MVLRNSSPEEEVNGFINFYKLLYYLDPFILVCVFLSMLLERRMIFLSSKPGVLSDCIQACTALLSPLSWQVQKILISFISSLALVNILPFLRPPLLFYLLNICDLVLFAYFR